MQYVRTDVLTENYVYVRAEELCWLGRLHCAAERAGCPKDTPFMGTKFGWTPSRTPGYSVIHTGTAVPSFDILYTYRLVVERAFGEMKKPGRLTQFQFRGKARVRLHSVMCSLMEQDRGNGGS